ncbi:MAG: hypothetical protein H6734_24485 [Alphaproteobacteria bacterium]|nr:hypothetical protein [Alphaproteobacteria bacterium]
MNRLEAFALLLCTLVVFATALSVRHDDPSGPAFDDLPPDIGVDERPHRAFSTMPPAECEHVFGDSAG